MAADRQRADDRDTDDKSLGDAATFAGARARPARDDLSLGDERTVGGADAAGSDTAFGALEVVDLAARYTVEGTLGQGGMGAVVLATDTRLDRKVAIKRILGEAAGNRVAVARFLTEAKAIAAINHPNIVQIYDYGRANDGPFLIMEYVDGGSLADRCRQGALPLDEAVDLACQICDGLAKAHDAGIVHRDIKPANVLLNRDGMPKLTDFGLAKADTADHAMTMTGAVMGTPDFMPPEQRRDAAEVDHRSDLWSLAATVYQMVTGRSPKIIRFNDIPAALQDVLGKALEDRKDARYQSARELRDALKTSVRAAVAAAPAAAGTVAEGRCPSCGVQNDPGRKFCKGCAASLVAPCLACNEAMPVWDEVCGSCGARQTPLVDVNRQKMAARQAEAEGLLGDFEFDRALAVATELRNEPHARLKHLASWATGFLEQIEKARAEQTRQAIEMFEEAAKHEAAFDYVSAILAAETIPDSLRGAVLPGRRETAAAMLARLEKTRAEVRRLESVVKARLTAKQIDELLPEVEKLLALKPDREDIQKIRGQLSDRAERLSRGRDEALALAKSALSEHDYDAAFAALSGVPAAAVTAEVVRLREESERLLRQARELAGRIKAAVAARSLDGLCETVEEYLRLKPTDGEMLALRQSLVAREEKYSAEIAARLDKAREYEQACRFDEAAKLLAKIPEFRRPPDAAACLDSALRFAPQRQQALIALRGAKAGDYPQALEASREYRSGLADAGLVDEEVAGLVAQAEAALERVRRRRRVVILSGVMAAGLAIAVVLGSVGLRMRAKAWAAAVATRVGEFAKADRLEEAERDLAEAEQGAAPAEAIATAKAMLAQGWLERARGSLASREVGGVPAAVEAARRLGAPEGLLSAVAAEALVLESVSLQAEGDGTQAAAKLLEASQLDAAIATAALQEPANGELRRSVLAEYRTRFDSAMTGRDWNTVVRLAAAAGSLDRSGSEWIAAALAAHPGGLAGAPDDVLTRVPAATIASLPPAMIAALPAATISALPPDTITALPPATLAAVPAPTILRLPPLRSSIGLELKLLPAGQFTMGRAESDSEDAPHAVTLTTPFYLGVSEVTNAQWERVMGTPPSEWKNPAGPVENVNWDDANAFCRKLSDVPEEKKAGRVYRLPTEAEWEYACRAGTTTRWSCGDEQSRLIDFGWIDENAGNQPHPVAQKKANAWGLFDMHGNVWEWCHDWIGAYGSDPVTDPQGPSGGSNRAFRGGGWYHAARYCRSAFRAGIEPSHRNSYLGFRLAMSAPGTRPDTSRSATEN